MVTKLMRPVPGSLPALAMLALLVVGLAGKAVANSVSLDAMLTKLAPPPSGEALSQIPDPGRKLLALRSYVRYGAKIADRWSWSKEQIKAFDGSPEHQALLAEIAAVSKHFRAANPGYEIYVHGTVRSLDEQLASWNNNNSVRAGAEEVLAAYKAAFGDDGLEPEKIDVKKLGAWLRDFKPSKRASLAAPGLTLHGRASAIDFQVMKDGRIYAGANSKQLKSVWRAEGWDEKLKASMEAVGPSFSGPLADPDEPWHYDYAPPPAATIASAQGAKLADILPATPGARACFARRDDAKHLSEHPGQRVAGVTFLIRSTGLTRGASGCSSPTASTNTPAIFSRSASRAATASACRRRAGSARMRKRWDAMSSATAAALRLKNPARACCCGSWTRASASTAATRRTCG